MTLRSLTSCQEAKFALIYFEVDETYSIIEARRVQTKIAGAVKERGCTVNVKIGRDVFEAEILELNDDKRILEETKNRTKLQLTKSQMIPQRLKLYQSYLPPIKRVWKLEQFWKNPAKLQRGKKRKTMTKEPKAKQAAKKVKKKLASLECSTKGPDKNINSSFHVSADVDSFPDRLYLSLILGQVKETMSSKLSPMPMAFTPKITHRGLFDEDISTPSSTSTPKRNSVVCSASRERIYTGVLNELLTVCKGILSRLEAIEVLQRQQHQQVHHSSPLPSLSISSRSLSSTPKTATPELSTTGDNAVEMEGLFVIPDDLIQFCKTSRRNSLSVGHFASVLTKHILADKERENRNCFVRRNKLALDPAKLGLVKKLVFRFYAIKDDDKERTWKNCVIRIDEMLRRKTKSS